MFKIWIKPIIIIIVVLMGFSGSMYGQDKQIKFHLVTGRPLDAAIRILADMTETLITFEEPAYYDDETRVRETVPGRGYSVPATRTLKFSVSREQALPEMISTLFEAGKLIDPDVSYVMHADERYNHVFNIMPERWLNADGDEIKFTSLFAGNVSFRVKRDESLRACMNRLLDYLIPYDANTDSVLVWGAAGGPVAWEREFGVTNAPAISLLNSILANHNARPHGTVIRSLMLRRTIRQLENGERRAVLNVVRAGAFQVKPDADHVFWMEHARPVAAALDAFDEVFTDCIIHYEGPNYSAGGVRRFEDGSPIGPIGDRFFYNFSSTNAVEEILADFLSRIKIAGVNFRVAKVSDQSYYVAPAESASPVLSRLPVSIASGGRSFKETLENVCLQLKKLTDTEVKLDLHVDKELLSRDINISVPESSFYAAMHALFMDVDHLLRWRLLHEPASDHYVLQVHARK